MDACELKLLFSIKTGKLELLLLRLKFGEFRLRLVLMVTLVVLERLGLAFRARFRSDFDL